MSVRDPALGRRLRWAIGAVGVVVAIAAVVLWPRGEAPDLGAQPSTYVDATVTATAETRCTAIEQQARAACTLATVQVTSGPDRGATGEFIVQAIELRLPTVHTGDRVVLLDIATSPPPYRYVFADFQRRTPLLGLAAIFAVAVMVFGRWQGARALAGLVASIAVLVAFIVPATLRGSPAVPVALVGTIAIAYAALYLAHGVNIATTVALAGTLASLVVTVALAQAAAQVAHLTGLDDPSAQLLRVTADAVNLRGLVVAGIVVGALGVLDDVTVSQVSTVAALRRVQPTASARDIYRQAIGVGRDHVASTVNTLVLAYAGASLPLLLLFSQGSKPVGRILTSEVVAVEIVRMLVGSIGLVLSVPITTALAAIVVSGATTLTPSDGGHTHAHPAHPARWEDFGPPEAAP